MRLKQMQSGRFGFCVFKTIKIAGGERHDAGTEGRGCRSFVFPRLRIDPVRQRHEGKLFTKPLAEFLFMAGIDIGMQ